MCMYVIIPIDIYVEHNARYESTALPDDKRQTTQEEEFTIELRT